MVETFQVDRQAIAHLWPALDVLRAACGAAGTTFFVVGAAARDLLLEHVYGVRSFRATLDVDVAVAVQGWDEYEAVMNRLVDEHGFERAREPHRLRRGDLLVDVVPFGEIAEGTGEITWPLGEATMSVVGYQEAYEAAVGIVVDDGPAIPVASLPGVGVLKLIAWSEAPYRRPQDPIDLCAIMTGYGEVIGDRLYHEHDDFLNEDDFDMDVAAARIYGRDTARLLRTEELRERILAVLAANTEDDYDSHFALAMGSECHSDFGRRLQYLRAFRLGVEERLDEGGGNLA